MVVRYLLIFHNNVGTANGADGPHDSKRNRRPAWISIGRVRDSAEGLPLAFGEPRVLADNDGVALPPEDQTQVATYGSFLEHEGRAIWWYPDRKHYLLGKIINDLLA